jgi:hypothetical protein
MCIFLFYLLLTLVLSGLSAVMDRPYFFYTPINRGYFAVDCASQ